MLGERGQCREKRDRLETGDLGVAAFSATEANREIIGQEIGVEKAALGCPGELCMEFETSRTVSGGSGVTPRGDMLSATGQESAELDLSGHCYLHLKLSDKCRSEEMDGVQLL
jgi:hypothetical protein